MKTFGIAHIHYTCKKKRMKEVLKLFHLKFTDILNFRSHWASPKDSHYSQKISDENMSHSKYLLENVDQSNKSNYI